MDPQVIEDAQIESNNLLNSYESRKQTDSDSLTVHQHTPNIKFCESTDTGIYSGSKSVERQLNQLCKIVNQLEDEP